VTSLLGQFIQFVQTKPVALEDSDSEEDRVRGPSVFDVLMEGARQQASGGCVLPDALPLGQYPRKNKLKNDIVAWLKNNSLGWSQSSVSALGVPFVQTVGDALWYIDRNHDTLQKRGCPVPIMFQQFSGYRIPEKQKKRTIDETFLRNDAIKAHSAALFNLGVSSYLKKDNWKSVYAAILSLAQSLQKYSEYQNDQAKRVS
jgi:hypothetical protein